MSCQRSAEMLEEASQAKCIRRRVILSAHEFSSELVQHVESFVRQPWTANYADRVSSVFFRDRIQLFSDVTNRFVAGISFPPFL